VAIFAAKWCVCLFLGSGFLFLWGSLVTFLSHVSTEAVFIASITAIVVSIWGLLMANYSYMQEL